MTKMKKEIEEPIVVRMTVGKNEKSTRQYTQTITNIASLGREVKVSPKSNVTINEAGFKIEFGVPTVDVLIGIGKDYTADLIMTEDAWKALKSGEEIHITTVKEFKKRFIKK